MALHTWIPFYKEFAKKILQFKDNREPLVKWIYENLESIDYLYINGNRLKDLDPFTVMGTFNRGISLEKRKKTCSQFKDFLKIQSDVPSDFQGVPILNHQRIRFIHWDETRKEQHERLENYWNLLEKAIKGDSFEEDYNFAISQKGINNMVSMALYWIDPDRYIALDSNNRKLMADNDINPSDKVEYVEYMEIIEKIKSITTSFADFSEKAFNTKHPNVWIWSDFGGTFDSDFVAIGSTFPNIKDYQQFNKKEDLRTACQKEKGNTDVAMPDAYWKFLRDVKEGDFIIVSKPVKEGKKYHREIYGWGIFLSDKCRFDESSQSPVIRDVEWIQKYETPIKEYSLHNTLFFFGTSQDTGKKIMKILGITSTDIETTTETMKVDSKISQIANLLRKKGQIVLQGAPGTGKTYITRNLAVYLCDGFLPETRQKLMMRYKKLEEEGRIGFTTFHQSMDYEEFVEGLKPDSKSEDSLRFDVKPGIFKRLCENATHDSSPYVLIIDEINRANISKVLGELITLLEWSKRIGNDDEYQVTLPYSNKKFGVPNNLYVIGTMNTADRSVGYIDYAIRRRFAFVTLKSNRSIIENNLQMETKAKAMALNAFDMVSDLIEQNINEDIDFDDVMIGHSYFLSKSVEDVKDSIEYEIKPLLLEYLHDGILVFSDELKEQIKSLSDMTLS